MAVQAQYPSNVILLNTRNGQEGHEYSCFQPQLIHQNHAHILCNNNGTSNTDTDTAAVTNSQKRGREELLQSTLINPFISSQSQQHLIHLSHLHNQQQNLVSTGLTLSFHDKQQQQQQQQRIQLHHQQQQQQHQHQAPISSTFSGLSSQFKQHQHEIDQYLRTQEEQLRRTLAEKRQMHYRQLLTAAEELMTQRLREKEAEFLKATRKNAELEARAAQLSVEAQVWQAKARAHEAAAASLQAQLQQTIMCQRGENSAGGISCAVEGQAEDAGSAYVDPDRVQEEAVARRKCRACGKRVASVVVLPCRHLCICTECDVHLRACPFCLTLKNSTVEVFLS